MLFAVVLIATVALSSAQEQPSPQCVAAFNATFRSSDTASTSCVEAYGTLLGNAATDQQRMMVCSAGQQCNSMIENVISLCGDTIELPTRLAQDLLCTTGPNGDTCLTTLFSSGEQNYFNDLIANCGVSCTQACMQTIMQVNSSWGCCFVEIAKIFGSTGSPYPPAVFTNIYPEKCGLRPFTDCNGQVLPTDACDTAFADLLGVDDECTRNVQAVFLTGNSSTNAILGLYDGVCPTRLGNYATACRDQSDNVLVRFATGIASVSQARNSDGRSCSDFVSDFFIEMEDEVEVNCNQDYFSNQCSTVCRQVFMNASTEYGCCLNTILAEFTGRSEEVTDQVEHAIITREIYSLCEIPSDGFCTGANPPSYSDAAERCIRARNSFISDSTCLEDYLALVQRSSAAAVNNAATDICASQRCKNRMSSYIDYLVNCRVENLLNDDDDDDDNDNDDNDDDDDDDDDDDEDTGYLDLAYLIGNTTCRVDSTNTSCYSSVYFNIQYAFVSAAFDTDGSAPVCASVLTEATCSAECKQILMTAISNVGCCLGEYGRALLGDDFLTGLSTICGIPSLDARCTEPEAIQDASVEGGTITKKGFGIIGILLLGMIPIMF